MISEEAVEAHRLWRKRIQTNLDVFASAVENDDVGVGVHAMMDIGAMGDEIGHFMLDMMFGRAEVVRMMSETVLQSGGSEQKEMETEDHVRWYRAMGDRGMWD